MSKITPQKLHELQTEILTWYDKHKRDLLWRKTRDPYAILVSEVMSQQTQINRVVSKYEAWMKRFPTLESLAEASLRDVLFHWSGLGYNRRARNLKKAAEIIVIEHGGEFPRTVSELKKLPGIGEYTASAIACFAFDEQIAVVDTNVRKVVLTKFISVQPNAGSGRTLSDKEIQAIAKELLPPGKAYEWNQALMDYASAMLRKEKIFIPKQSKFQGSNRYYRGQTVKILLEERELSITSLQKRLEKDREAVEKIVTALEKEGLVKRNKHMVSIS